MSVRTVWAGFAIGVGLLAAAPQDQSDVHKVGGDVTAPRVISRSDPQYTDEAQAAKVEGTVLLSIVIAPDGLAHNINVVKGIGSGLENAPWTGSIWSQARLNAGDDPAKL